MVFLLQFLLSVGKAASLLLHLVLALETSKPKSAKLSLDLLLPCTFLGVLPLEGAALLHVACL